MAKKCLICEDTMIKTIGDLHKWIDERYPGAVVESVEVDEGDIDVSPVDSIDQDEVVWRRYQRIKKIRFVMAVAD